YRRRKVAVGQCVGKGIAHAEDRHDLPFAVAEGVRRGWGHEPCAETERPLFVDVMGNAGLQESIAQTGLVIHILGGLVGCGFVDEWNAKPEAERPVVGKRDFFSELQMYPFLTGVIAGRGGGSILEAQCDAALRARKIQSVVVGRFTLGGGGLVLW